MLRSTHDHSPSGVGTGLRAVRHFRHFNILHSLFDILRFTPARPPSRLSPRTPLLRVKSFLLLALLLTLSTQARVFTRSPSAADVATLFESLGGRLIYESRVRVNDGDGDLAIFGLDTPLEPLLASLRQSLNTDTLAAAGNLATGLIVRDDAILRLVITQPDPQGQIVAFTIRQTPAEYQRSAIPPTARVLAGLQPYPGSSPHFIAEDAHTGAAFAVSTASAAPADIREYYSTELRGSGWQPLLPSPPREGGAPRRRPPPASSPDRLLAFSKGDDLCFLLVTTAPDSAESTITLLHKRPGMK